MKTKTSCWAAALLLGSGILLSPIPCPAVNGDSQPPCWRGQTGTTRQTWRFDTDASPLSPEVVANGAGSPQAVISPNLNGAGWVDTTCALYGFGCEPWNYDPDPFGTAQGYWDLGGTNASAPQPGTVLLTIPDSVTAGATRYVWVQATVFIESGFFAYPTCIVSNAIQVGAAANLLVENPTNSDGSFSAGAWYNQQTLWSVPATGSVVKVQLRAAGVGTILDTVTVDTMHRSAAGADAAVTPQGLATNLTATVLANDGGPTLTVVGAGSPTAAGGTASAGGGNLTYTPPSNYTGPDTFYYTNSDCAGGLAAAQVTVTVTGTGVPVANTDTVTRTPGLTLKIHKAGLLLNDTGTGLSFSGLNLTSTNGASVTTNATTIFYSNPNNVADRLTYYIQDNTSARAGGYVLIQMSAGTTNNGSTVVRLQTGVPGVNTNTLTLAGIPNYQYIVQFATNAGGEVWFNLSTNTAGANGLWIVQDPTATNSQRYYRVTVP